MIDPPPPSVLSVTPTIAPDRTANVGWIRSMAQSPSGRHLGMGLVVRGPMEAPHARRSCAWASETVRKAFGPAAKPIPDLTIPLPIDRRGDFLSLTAPSQTRRRVPSMTHLGRWGMSLPAVAETPPRTMPPAVSTVSGPTIPF